MEEKELKLNIESIFNSIDGEYNGLIGAGELTTFIRVHGCNLQCTYCDTEYAQDMNPGTIGFLTVDEIIKRYNILPKVTITGGEPFIHPAIHPLIEKLVEMNCQVSIETNGCIRPPQKYFTDSFLRHMITFVQISNFRLVEKWSL